MPPSRTEPSLPYVTTREALTAQLKAFLKAKNVVAPQVTDVLAEFVQDRLAAQRDRLATLVENMMGIYEELTQEQMETLANLIRNHVVDDRAGHILPAGDD